MSSALSSAIFPSRAARAPGSSSPTMSAASSAGSSSRMSAAASSCISSRTSAAASSCISSRTSAAVSTSRPATRSAAASSSKASRMSAASCGSASTSEAQCSGWLSRYSSASRGRRRARPRRPRASSRGRRSRSFMPPGIQALGGRQRAPDEDRPGACAPGRSRWVCRPPRGARGPAGGAPRGHRQAILAGPRSPTNRSSMSLPRCGGWGSPASTRRPLPRLEEVSVEPLAGPLCGAIWVLWRLFGPRLAPRFAPGQERPAGPAGRTVGAGRP